MSPQLPLTFLPLFFLLTLPLQATSQNHHESSFLLQLKQQWNLTFLNWNPNGTDHCTDWTGVNCTNGSVTFLSLYNYNVTYSIPPSFCDRLSSLVHLDLSFNYFSGNFPTFLYNCSNLQYLDLSQNTFQGQIPSDIDRLSPNLLYLNLGYNKFSGVIPPAIGRLPSLQSLYLLMNQFNDTVPPEIGNLSNLEHLEMGYNPFTKSTIPSQLGKLKKLKYLWISDAKLIGEIPKSFVDLVSLEHLDLATNQLSGELPEGLFLLRNLTHLYLYSNGLSGEIPRRIETLSLREIDISRNGLSGTIPEAFGKLRNLVGFDMYDNRLSGEIPASIGRIPSLARVRLFNNSLNGSLPPELGLHSKLIDLEVCENQLSGNLPEYLCAGGVLIGLVVYNNNLSGEVPKSYANCHSLATIQLYRNNFSGVVPAGIFSLNNLSSIIIHDNSFSGELPDEFAWNLTRLVISNNRFSGKIPSGIKSSKNLLVFEGSNNLLSGEIPIELTTLSKLLTLSLDRNKLSRQIPSEIASWKSLVTLDLRSNQISGQIPPRIGLLLHLNGIDLSDNQLSGEIPPQIGNLMLSFLNLSSNRLTGRIPDEFENSAFDGSFLNNSGLCAQNHLLKLSPCISKPHKSSKLSSSLLALILIISLAIFIASALLTLYVIRDYLRKKKEQDLSTWKLTSFQSLHFSEQNILSSLNENNLIGSGGSGKVYRVSIARSGESVAVKKIWSKGMLLHKLEKEFEAEVQILGTIRHSNIVKLLCCISCEKSKLLVYEYMVNGSLDRWLHAKRSGSSVSSSVHHVVLDWPTRLQIAVGAAQGLCYMHHDCSPPVIHRDVKSSNILLDSEFKAKIADFGLAKMLARGGEPKTMSAVAGSFGYFAPEYAYTTKVNEKIDIYSFGVVLLELVTGKEANYGDEHTCLAEWAWRHFQDGNSIVDALDEEIKEPCYIDEMSMVFKIGLICTGTLPSTRPSMKDVLRILLKCGPQQDSKEESMFEDDAHSLLTCADSSTAPGHQEGSQHRRAMSEKDGCSLVCNV